MLPEGWVLTSDYKFFLHLNEKEIKKERKRNDETFEFI